MCDTMALPIATPTWSRRVRRLFVVAALALGLGGMSWSLVEMADDEGLVAEFAGYRVSATIDEQMMLSLAISHVQSARPEIKTTDQISSLFTREADYVYYDVENQDDEMVDLPADYQVAGERNSVPKT